MSKDLQINYTIKATDLSKKDIDQAIKNQKRLYDSLKKQDKDRIVSKNAVLSQMSSKKEAVRQALANKKGNDLYLARHKQLLSRKSYMDKIRSLKMLKGDENALKNYIKNTERKLKRVRSRVFANDDHKRKYENTLKEMSLMNIRNRAETMLGSAINSNNRKRERALKLQRRQVELQRRLADRTRDMHIAVGVGSTAALYGGVRASLYSFRQAMTLEQMGISMRAQYGVEGGNKVLKEMKEYARDTAFTLREATQLLLGVKIGAGNIGISGTQNQVAFTKEIGKAILAYGGNVEDRYEIGHQLSQIFMAGSANERQDLKVLLRRGLPIYTALQAMTGLNVKQLKDKHGAELPAQLIADAMRFMVRSPQVMRAWSEREESFVQAWESTSEQFGYTAGALGDRLAKMMELPAMLRSATKGLAVVEDSILQTGSEGEGTNWLGYITSIGALTLSILSLKGALSLIARGFSYFAGTAIAASLGLNGMRVAALTILSSLGKAFGWASAIYLVIADWSSTFDNINKHGLKGLLKDLDKVVAVISVLGLGFATGGIPGFLIAAAGLAGVGVYKTLKEVKKNDDKYGYEPSTVRGKILSKLGMASFDSNYSNKFEDYTDLVTKRRMEEINSKYERPDGSIGPSRPREGSMLRGLLKPNVEVNNYINAATGETKTEVRSVYEKGEPVFTHWNKNKPIEAY